MPKKYETPCYVATNVLESLIDGVLPTRAELNVPAKSKVNIIYANVSSDLEEIIEKNKEIIVSLTRSDSFKKEEYSKDEGMVQVIFNDGLIYLSLKGIIDFEEEKRRLQKNLKKTELELSKIHSKLNDKNFINNAPEEIILEQKEREKEYQLSKDKITKTAMMVSIGRLANILTHLLYFSAMLSNKYSPVLSVSPPDRAELR